MKIIWAKEARQQLKHIREYIEKDNPVAAERVVRRIQHVAQILSDHPYAGRKGTVTGTRELVVAGTPFILIYRIMEDKVGIATVLHGAQKYPS